MQDRGVLEMRPQAGEPEQGYPRYRKERNKDLNFKSIETGCSI